MQKKQGYRIRLLSVLLGSAMVAGCASKLPQGYGVAKSTASLAQEQMVAAEQATQVDTASTYLGLIEKMQQAGHWYASLAHTDAFERLHGSSTNIQLLRADALRNTQQYDAAKRLYMNLLNTGQASRAYRGIGLLEAGQGRYEEAVAALDKARRLNPVDPNILSDMGYALMLSGQLDEAHLPVMQASQLAPNSPRVQLNLALFLMASGQETLGGQLVQKLQQPAAKSAGALIGADAIASLQEQVLLVKRAVQMRRDAANANLTEVLLGKVIKVSSMAVEAVPLSGQDAAQLSLYPKGMK